MRAIALVAIENFRLLRRDRIFVPVLFACVLISFLANLVSGWSIEEFQKILVDLGFFGFQMTGSAVSVFWAVKTLADARESGALEVQLAAPIARVSWLVGRYLGLSAALVLLSLMVLGFWQGFMLLNQFSWMQTNELIAFAFLPLTWLVLAAMAMTLATFCTQGVALFATASLWLAGQTTSLVEAALPPETDAVTRQVVQTLARFWDLQQLNLVDFATGLTIINPTELLLRALYGVLLIAIFLTAGSLVFRSRDAI